MDLGFVERLRVAADNPCQPFSCVRHVILVERLQNRQAFVAQVAGSEGRPSQDDFGWPADALRRYFAGKPR